MRIPSDDEWLQRARTAAQLRSSELGGLVEVELLPAHASLRRYARARFGARSEILMMMPPRDAAPDEAGAEARGPLADDPFVQVQRWLDAHAVPVPALYAVDEVSDGLWLEDLGGTDFDQWVSSDSSLRVDRYRMALDVLLRFNEVTVSAESLPATIEARTFGRELLRWELDHYVEWRVECELGRKVDASEREKLNQGFDGLVDQLVGIPVRPMHRDYQSHNIMVTGDDEPRLVLLDFQDAMMGPAIYDSVALLRDSYVVLDQSELSALVAYYAERRAALPDLGAATSSDVSRWFYLQTVQRKLKDAGRFVYIDRVKKNPAFLRYIPDSLAYVRAALAGLPGLGELHSILAELDPAFR